MPVNIDIHCSISQHMEFPKDQFQYPYFTYYT